MKSYADDLDRIEREYRQRMRKCEAEFTRRYNSVYSQLKSQQVPSSLELCIVVVRCLLRRATKWELYTMTMSCLSVCLSVCCQSILMVAEAYRIAHSVFILHCFVLFTVDLSVEIREGPVCPVSSHTSFLTVHNIVAQRQCFYYSPSSRPTSHLRCGQVEVRGSVLL